MNWRDPYPKPKLVEHEGFFVVRDDLLSFGSKVRFIDALINQYESIEEFVYGSCPAQGWGQISLTAAAKRYGKKAVYFMAQRAKENLTLQQKFGIALGGDYRWVPDGMLTVTQKRARDYVAEKPSTRMLLPIGLEHPIVLSAIAKVARGIKLPGPKEIWSVGSSGCLSRGLQLAFPNAVVHVVSVGHKMGAAEIGRATMWRHPLPFEKSVATQDAPPYPSVANYDAKVWSFVRDHASKGAWVWNVAADLKESDLKAI